MSGTHFPWHEIPDKSNVPFSVVAIYKVRIETEDTPYSPLQRAMLKIFRLASPKQHTIGLTVEVDRIPGGLIIGDIVNNDRGQMYVVKNISRQGLLLKLKAVAATSSPSILTSGDWRDAGLNLMSSLTHTAKVL